MTNPLNKSSNVISSSENFLLGHLIKSLDKPFPFESNNKHSYRFYTPPFGTSSEPYYGDCITFDLGFKRRVKTHSTFFFDLDLNTNLLNKKQFFRQKALFTSSFNLDFPTGDSSFEKEFSLNEHQFSFSNDVLELNRYHNWFYKASSSQPELPYFIESFNKNWNEISSFGFKSSKSFQEQNFIVSSSFFNSFSFLASYEDSTVIKRATSLFEERFSKILKAKAFAFFHTFFQETLYNYNGFYHSFLFKTLFNSIYEKVNGSLNYFFRKSFTSKVVKQTPNKLNFFLFNYFGKNPSKKVLPVLFNRFKKYEGGYSFLFQVRRTKAQVWSNLSSIHTANTLYVKPRNLSSNNLKQMSQKRRLRRKFFLFQQLLGPAFLTLYRKSSSNFWDFNFSFDFVHVLSLQLQVYKFFLFKHTYIKMLKNKTFVSKKAFFLNRLKMKFFSKALNKLNKVKRAKSIFHSKWVKPNKSKSPYLLKLLKTLTHNHKKHHTHRIFNKKFRRNWRSALSIRGLNERKKLKLKKKANKSPQKKRYYRKPSNNILYQGVPKRKFSSASNSRQRFIYGKSTVSEYLSLQVSKKDVFTKNYLFFMSNFLYSSPYLLLESLLFLSRVKSLKLLNHLQCLTTYRKTASPSFFNPDRLYKSIPFTPNAAYNPFYLIILKDYIVFFQHYRIKRFTNSFWQTNIQQKVSKSAIAKKSAYLNIKFAKSKFNTITGSKASNIPSFFSRNSVNSASFSSYLLASGVNYPRLLLGASQKSAVKCLTYLEAYKFFLSCKRFNLGMRMILNNLLEPLLIVYLNFELFPELNPSHSFYSFSIQNQFLKDALELNINKLDRSEYFLKLAWSSHPSLSNKSFFYSMLNLFFVSFISSNVLENLFSVNLNSKTNNRSKLKSLLSEARFTALKAFPFRNFKPRTFYNFIINLFNAVKPEHNLESSVRWSALNFNIDAHEQAILKTNFPSLALVYSAFLKSYSYPHTVEMLTLYKTFSHVFEKYNRTSCVQSFFKKRLQFDAVCAYMLQKHLGSLSLTLFYRPNHFRYFISLPFYDF